MVGAAIFYHFGFRQRFEVTSAAKIRVFLNQDQTLELQQGQTLTWGPIVDTDPKTMTLYIKNIGTVGVTLEFNYRQDQIPQGWLQSWDYDGDPVPVGDTETVIITLMLPSTIGAGEYGCDSWITATPV